MDGTLDQGQRSIDSMNRQTSEDISCTFNEASLNEAKRLKESNSDLKIVIQVRLSTHSIRFDQQRNASHRIA